MFKIEFYEDRNGYSELREQIRQLAINSKKNKNERIQNNKIWFFIELLNQKGTYLPSEITKHPRNDIWELRPGHNRILYFYFKDNTFVLLHMFRKTTKKTPYLELERAEQETNDYRLRNGGNHI